MGFEGAWRVREYVYDTDGVLRGTVRQRRLLETLEPGLLRLTQHCDPDASLDGHPMAEFRGTHVFDLRVTEGLRSYLGPAVVGTGRTFGPHVMWGEGVWPHFGHRFASYALNLGEQQLTGGWFFRGNALSARIAGIARPEQGEGWPSLEGPHHPKDVGAHWVGTQETYRADGLLLSQRPAERTYTATGWEEPGRWTFTDGSPVHLTDGTFERTGTEVRAGWLTERDLVGANATHMRSFEALDATRGRLFSITRNYLHHELMAVFVLHLTCEAT